MRGRRSSIALVLLALLTAGVTASVLGHAGERGLGVELVIGIVTSLLGSFILIAARLMSSNEPRHSAGEPHIAGLIRLTTKERIEPDEWLRLLEKAQDEFYIAGHSLGKWCSASNARVFKGEVKRITGQRGHVTLVMLDPSSEQIRRLQRPTRSRATRVRAAT